MIGKCFNLINPNLNITFGIICYLFSFFLVELLILFFLQDMSINYSFGITNMLGFFFLKNLNEKKYFFIIIFSYFTMFFLIINSFEWMTLNPNLLGMLRCFLSKYRKNIQPQLFPVSFRASDDWIPQFLSYLDAMIYKITLVQNLIIFFKYNFSFFSGLIYF